MNRKWMATAGALIAVAPFCTFFRYNEFSPFSSHVVLPVIILLLIGAAVGFIAGSIGRLAGALVIAALVTLYLDIQLPDLSFIDKHAHARLLVAAAFAISAGLVWLLWDEAGRLLSLTFGAIVASTLLLPVGDPLSADRQQSAASTETRSEEKSLPFMLHIVLDEHQGVGGFPDVAGAELVRSETRDFYQTNGFHLFENAHSQYFNTGHSLAALFNFDPDSGGKFFESNTFKYFHWLKDRGFRLSIFSTNLINFCRDPSLDGKLCYIYRTEAIDSIAEANLTAPEKLRIVFSAYLYPSLIYQKLAMELPTIKSLLVHDEDALPSWSPEQAMRVQPIKSMQVLGELKKSIELARRGDAVFAHLILPHHPYVYDAACDLRPPEQWLNRNMDSGVNTSDSRKIRYERYLEQILCTNRKLGEIFDVMRKNGLWENSVIVLHGDHGSRIVIDDPYSDNPESVTPENLRDGYNAHVAIRFPNSVGSRDGRVVSLLDILSALARSNLTSVDDLPSMNETPTIYLRHTNDFGFTPHSPPSPPTRQTGVPNESPIGTKPNPQ